MAKGVRLSQHLLCQADGSKAEKLRDKKVLLLLADYADRQA
jgi:hypothetical protein